MGIKSDFGELADDRMDAGVRVMQEQLSSGRQICPDHFVGNKMGRAQRAYRVVVRTASINKQPTGWPRGGGGQDDLHGCKSVAGGRMPGATSRNKVADQAASLGSRRTQKYIQKLV